MLVTWLFTDVSLSPSAVTSRAGVSRVSSFCRRSFVLLAVLAIGCAFPSAAEQSTSLNGASWRAGIARENITPPPGLWMTGFAARTRPADGTEQDLWVKALAFQDPTGERGVLLTLDLCEITRVVSEHV